MRRFGLITTLAVVLLVVAITTAAVADRPKKAARYRVRHGGKVALAYFERRHTFERFNSQKAARLEPNLSWVDGETPHRGQVDIAFTGERRLLLITSTYTGRWFCTVTSGGGKQRSGSGQSFQSVDSKQECTA